MASCHGDICVDRNRRHVDVDHSSTSTSNIPCTPFITCSLLGWTCRAFRNDFYNARPKCQYQMPAQPGLRIHVYRDRWQLPPALNIVRHEVIVMISLLPQGAIFISWGRQSSIKKDIVCYCVQLLVACNVNICLVPQ